MLQYQFFNRHSAAAAGQSPITNHQSAIGNRQSAIGNEY
jgi:hypothetical protein